MCPTFADGLQADRDEVERLAEACRRLDGVEAPLQLGEPAERFLSYENGALVGCLELVGTSEAEGCGMVRPDRRRRGIGRALLAAARQEWRERGFVSFLLVCDAAAVSGAAFAAAVGASYSFAEDRMELDATRLPPQSGGPVRLRRAAEYDVDAFVRIMMAAFRNDPAEARQVRQNTVERFRDPNRQSYIAELDGMPVGGVEAFHTPGGSGEFINSLGVDPEHQRRGYGRQILVETARALIAEGSQRVMLEVETDNRSAISLYLDCGFETICTFEYYRVDV
ncbi:MAG: GNAT family N-acetyltransferase [SAR202 cluster bacterium]|jgi:ribosomal protein S18 acetylase RimI-like enzyme|nr:GNAT family N-acetyltransferase [SAR202 cluster bacterium]MQG69480.1 GNAT family N-acetyltransferase [SAR202 cluster bacterium]|tara:strand:- start:12468 stop:13310 length:843 start_codon:yes stop_codon:yes gene_type:complete